MKMKMKASDLVEILAPGPVSKRLQIISSYGIDDKKFRQLRVAMHRGKWRLV